MTLILIVVLVALVFEYINGFHDTANSIATVVSTKVLSPRQAVVLAAVTNLLGAMLGTAVAKTITSGLVVSSIITQEALICALLGAIVWNLITWYYGIPSSSSHALVGGLMGAALAIANNDWGVIIWSKPAMPWYKGSGYLWKVLIPMVTSPLCGLILGFLLMGFLYFLFRNWKPHNVNRTFGIMQLVSSASMGYMHGTNDAQKTMGIIALALVAGTSSGAFHDLPPWLDFLKTSMPEKGKDLEIATWIKITCAVTMAAGTAAGGWRIIKTLGHRMVKLQPVHGFAAESVSAAVIGVASKFGMPVSTTHNISAAIMGVGAAKRFSAVRWSIVERMVWAWILTIPVTGGLAWLFVKIALATGLAVSAKH